jgi:uncharacterized membrane protein YphA (DoxX/SURF4 family)
VAWNAPHLQPPAATGGRGWQAWLDWARTVARVGLATVWVWAGLAKIADPGRAVLSVRAYRLLPEALVRPVAWGLPFLELAVAVLLLTGIATRLAAATSAGLLVVFMLGIAAAWARGLQIDCGCFDAGGRTPRSAPRSTLVSCCATAGCCWSRPT